MAPDRALAVQRIERLAQIGAGHVQADGQLALRRQAIPGRVPLDIDERPEAVERVVALCDVQFGKHPQNSDYWLTNCAILVYLSHLGPSRQ